MRIHRDDAKSTRKELWDDIDAKDREIDSLQRELNAIRGLLRNASIENEQLQTENKLLSYQIELIKGVLQYP